MHMLSKHNTNEFIGVTGTKQKIRLKGGKKEKKGKEEKGNKHMMVIA